MVSRALMERKALEHEQLKRIAAHSRKEREAARALAPEGPFTTGPEPEGDGWDSAVLEPDRFAAAGLCELWRMDFGDVVAGRFEDFPPGFNFSGLWWRPAFL